MRKPLLHIFTGLSFLLLAAAGLAQDTRYEWDLSDLYADDAAWESAMTELKDQVEEFSSLQGSLGESAASMADALSQLSNTTKELMRAYIYTSLSRDTDQRDPDAQSQFGRAMQLYSDWGAATSWVSPEILDIGADRIQTFLAEEPRLAPFEFMLEDTLRMAPHTLDEQTEAILAQAALLLASPQQIYENYANADIPWPSVTLSDGSEVELTQAGYARWRGADNREDRKRVFDAFWKTWDQYADGMGATLATEVQSNIFSARARNYDSVLQMNLFEDGLPEEIYTQLITQINDALPTFHRYLKLRARILGIDDLAYYDIYPPMVNANTGTFDLKRSEEITLQALQPFGEEYLELLEYGFSQNWMHSHPQAGKRSGAYMNGSAYDVHPYVLLNHNDDYESMSTLAHEWGHAVHTLLANANNPFETADYSIFTAEIASTINEILLQEYMIDNAKTDEEKLFYLDAALEGLRGTLFRQTMFAEFELAIHETAERGDPLNGPVLTKLYGDLLKKYHGHDEGVMNIDDAYTVEWAYIPHFYYDFYVFQYATSITGAAWFAEKFLAGDTQVRDDFLNVLKAGGSANPHEILLQEAGLDLTKAAAYEPVLRRMNSLMDRIEALID